jgi:hypothetical protein
VKRLGPELKPPKLGGGGVKAPPFLSDLYFDLRERRLLPLVVLVLVAIVATPFLVGGSSKKVKPVPTPGPTAGIEPSAQRLDVVKAEPGLRNYKHRLAHRSPTNPFKQRFDEPQLEGGQLNEPAPGESGEPSSGLPPSGEPIETSPGSEGGSGGTIHRGGLIFYTFVANVQITKIVTKPDGSVEKTGPTLHKEVVPPAVLPGEKAQVVTYMGIAKDRKPIFLISPKVESMFGEGKCLSGEETCQLIELEPGFPETFAFGENKVRYKINVLKVFPKIISHS